MDLLDIAFCGFVIVVVAFISFGVLASIYGEGVVDCWLSFKMSIKDKKFPDCGDKVRVPYDESGRLSRYHSSVIRSVNKKKGLFQTDRSEPPLKTYNLEWDYRDQLWNYRKNKRARDKKILAEARRRNKNMMKCSGKDWTVCG